MGTRSATRVRRSLAAIVLLLVAACAPPASYPDRADVVTAQTAWCDALAKVNGQPDKWDYAAACKADVPSASSPYLRGMAKCMAERHEGYGKSAPDAGLIAAECAEEVSYKMPPDTGHGREVIDARCRWAERCAKVAVPDCKAAIDKLESSQRVLFTTRFNSAALHDVAVCLDASACRDDENAAYEACYKPATDKLLWYPR